MCHYALNDRSQRAFIGARVQLVEWMITKCVSRSGPIMPDFLKRRLFPFLYKERLLNSLLFFSISFLEK